MASGALPSISSRRRIARSNASTRAMASSYFRTREAARKTRFSTQKKHSARRERSTDARQRKMLLLNCAACAAPLAHDAPRCVRCQSRYCDENCQHDHWRRGHKQMCKKIHRGGNAEQYHANKKYKEAVAVAVEACADDTRPRRRSLMSHRSSGGCSARLILIRKSRKRPRLPPGIGFVVYLGARRHR